MKFQQEIKKHLSEYKKNKFPNLPNGKWRKIEYEHILPKENMYLNLIEYYREKFLKSSLNNIKFHMYFNHLNSSQGMCINFFYPIFFEKKLDLIIYFLGLKNEKVNYGSVRFEKLSEIDGVNNRRPMNFDFYFETQSGKKFFFEIKYTETEFGKAKNDAEHIEKYNKIYKGNFEPIELEFCSQRKFFQNYQIIRNLIHIQNNSYVIFLYPRENKKIKEEAQRAKNKILKKEFRDNFRAVEWIKLLDFIEKNNSHDGIKTQLIEFRKKYCVITLSP